MRNDSGEKRKYGWKALCPVIHMIVSVLYGVFFFRHMEYPFGRMLPAYDVNFSEECESVVHILMSGIFGFLMICMVWHIFFLLIQNKRKFPFLLIALSFVVCFLVFPGNFSYEPDNLLSYSSAVRNIPDYWQSIYLGCLYRACLYVFPHPLTLSFIQLSSLMGVVCYISEKVKGLFGKRAGILPWLAVLFPEFWEIGMSSYRNCIYTIMCLWFFSVLFFDYMEKRKRTEREMVCICAAGGFLTVFRSEGIVIVGILTAALLLVYELPLKEMYKALTVTLCICIILAVPQKLGEKKYYGKDYSMINSMNILKSILSDKNVNLGFDTAEEDLTAINRIVSLEGLMIFGIHEYRSDNFVEKNSINQSFASQKEQEDFMKGAADIIIHNLGLYFKDRLVMFCEANGISRVEQEPPPTEEWNQMFSMLTLQWNYCYNEIIADSYPKLIFQNAQKAELSNTLVDIQSVYYDWFCDTNLMFISRIAIFMLFPVLVFYDQKINKKRERVFFIWVLLLLLIQLAAIILFCPEERGVYYYPIFFVMLLGCFLLIMDIMEKSKKVKTILPPVSSKLGTSP